MATNTLIIKEIIGQINPFDVILYHNLSDVFADYVIPKHDAYDISEKSGRKAKYNLFS